MDALSAYLAIAMAQDGDPSLSGSYNAGPDRCLSSREIATQFASAWGGDFAFAASEAGNSVREANALMLDSSLIREALGWRPCWGIEKAVAMTVDWCKRRLEGSDMEAETDRQIGVYLRDAGGRDAAS